LLLESEVARHRCPPLWEVWCPEVAYDRDDAWKIRAVDAEHAVEKWAQEYDSNGNGDYPIVGGDTPIVHVAAVDSDCVQTFQVHGTMAATYWANELKGQKRCRPDG
jgi:hypothetical protein